MYVPSIHRPKDLTDVYDYLKLNGFATLVSQINSKNIASHIPLYLDKKSDQSYRLLGHVAAANEQKKCFDGHQEMLAIFMNTHAYVSSSWYDHINVPTWNYISIHIYGKATVLEGEELYNSINNIVNQYEHDRPNRFHLSDMPDKMQKAHFKGLVGFQMSIDKIETAFKLSQNRNEHDYSNVISKLENEGNPGSHNIAKEMKKLRS